MSGTSYALALVFKCRRCHEGDVVFTWQPAAASFPMEGRCGKCRTPHRLTVEAVEEPPA